MMFWCWNRFYPENVKTIVLGTYGHKNQIFYISIFDVNTVSPFRKWVYSLLHLSWTINSLSNSLPSQTIFNMSSSSFMLANLTIASSDVYRVNKRGNCFLYLTLIAPLCLQIMQYFGNNFFADSPDLRTLLALLDIDVLSPSDFLLAMFKPIVNFL